MSDPKPTYTPIYEPAQFTVRTGRPQGHHRTHVGRGFKSPVTDALLATLDTDNSVDIAVGDRVHTAVIRRLFKTIKRYDLAFRYRLSEDRKTITGWVVRRTF